jgi:AraC-like DNA-binding protein
MHETPDILHKTPNLPLRLVGAGSWEAIQGRHFPLHQHVTWELTYYREGHIECVVGNNVYAVQPGMFILTPPETVHAEYAWTTGYANYFITIDAPPDHPWPRVCFDDADRTFESICRSLVREWAGQVSNREQLLALLLGQLDVLLMRVQEQRQVSSAEQLIREVEQILEARYMTSLSIQAIAKEVGVSPSTLRAQFARLRGRTPLAHLQSLRIQHALAMIHNSDLTLEVIADFCGFHSASHLSRYVKRATGKSPGTFRH